MDIYSSYFGKRLHAAMVKSGLNQTNFALKLGVNQSQVSKWVKGKDLPKKTPIEDICQVLEVPVSWFLPQWDLGALNDKVPGTTLSYGGVLFQLKDVQPVYRALALSLLYLKDMLPDDGTVSEGDRRSVLTLIKDLLAKP